MFHDGYSFYGMHLVWWMVWIVIAFWIFVLPFNIPGQRIKKDTPLNILKKRFASGHYTNEEYAEKKKLLEEVEVKP